MEALHQLAELFQQSVTKNNDTPNSVAPPRISPTQQAPQARVPIRTTPAHNAHPHRSKNIEDNHRNQPLGVNHGNQPLRLGLPPQRETSRPHYIPPDFVTSPRMARIHHQPVTPYPRVECDVSLQFCVAEVNLTLNIDFRSPILEVDCRGCP